MAGRDKTPMESRGLRISMMDFNEIHSQLVYQVIEILTFKNLIDGTSFALFITLIAQMHQQVREKIAGGGEA
jgi:hypothetical protein